MSTRSFDHKEKQLIAYYTERVRAGCFDELDLHALLILLREHATGETPVRELGDFLAHRVRDRGKFLRFLIDHRAQIEMLSPTEDLDSTSNDIIDLALQEPGVYTELEVLSSLNSVLTLAGLHALPLELASDILVCTMSILQDVRFIDEQNVEVGKLVIFIAKKRIGLFGMIRLSDGRLMATSLLSTENLYLPFEPRTSKDAGMAPNAALLVIRASGKLRLMCK